LGLSAVFFSRPELAINARSQYWARRETWGWLVSQSHIAGRSVLLSDVLGAFSYALDMTEGQPEGHCVRACWIGTQIGQAIGLADDELRELYYTLLLKDLGCSSNAARICALYVADDQTLKRDFKLLDGGTGAALQFVLTHTGLKADLATRFRAIANIMRNGGEIVRELVEVRCQRGADIARRLRFSEAVADGIRNLDEHWDGRGKPLGLRGRTIPIYAQIALLAQVVDVFHTAAGRTAAEDEVARRSGSWFDPRLVQAFQAVARSDELWVGLTDPRLSERVLRFEPGQRQIAVDEDYLDDIAGAFGQVVDAKSPFTAGHSVRVAHYAQLICAEMGVAADRTRWIKRAAMLHDIGKLAVSNSLLDKPGKLEGDEWRIMMDHARHTGTILARISAFDAMAPIAAAHHERIDGKGYPLGLSGDQITTETRIISVADFFDALTADRPYRKAISVEKSLAIMAEGAGNVIDPVVFDALKSGIGLSGENLREKPVRDASDDRRAVS
jgi:putative nucleotidyltransferase with HDIG domain